MKDKMTVVDAVNHYRASHEWRYYDTVIFWGDCIDVCAIKGFASRVDDRHYEVICTKQEFNQCVKEMSESSGYKDLANYHVFLSHSKRNNLETKLEPVDTRTKEQKQVDEAVKFMLNEYTTQKSLQGKMVEKMLTDTIKKMQASGLLKQL